MKKITLSIAALLCLAGSVIGQDRKNVIKMNLWSPVVSTWNFAYERAISEKTTVQLGFAYTTKNYLDTKYRGYQIQPEVRFYLSEKSAPAGFYVAPFARYRSLSATAESEVVDPNTGMPTGETETAKATWSSYGGGLVVGGQWLFAGDRIAFGIFGGPAFYAHSFDYEGTATEEDFNFKGNGGFAIRSGVTFGVAF